MINMASILGMVGFAMSSADVAAKHGVLGMTKAAAWEHAADGVRVNAVGPGFSMTPLLEANLDQATMDSWPANTLCNGWGGPRRWPSSSHGWAAMPPPSSPAPTTPWMVAT